MGKKYNFTQEQLEEIMAAKAKNRNKQIDKRLSKQTVQSITGRQWILRCFN